MKFAVKLKEKWDVKTNRQFILILIVFAITGSATVIIRKPIFTLVGINETTPFLLKALLYIAIVTPSYLSLLLCVAFIFGQFRFFWNFEKQMFKRLMKKQH